MWGEMNIVSKYAIKYGTVLILTLVIIALYCLYMITAADSPFAYLTMYDDLLCSIKECVGAVYVLPLLAEIILMASGKKN